MGWECVCRGGWGEARFLTLGRAGRGDGGCIDPPPLPPPPGYTPLHIAVLRKDLELVQLLLGAGADPNQPVRPPPHTGGRQRGGGGGLRGSP